MSTEEIKKMYSTLAKLRKIIVNETLVTDCLEEYVVNIIEKGFDINYQIPADSYLALRNPHLVGSTILHILYSKVLNVPVFEMLSKHGADFTIGDRNGQTILHKMIDHWRENSFSSVYYDENFTNSLFKSTALFVSKNPLNLVNPCHNGLSHFHIACMTNHVEAARYFLDIGVPIDQIVNENSSSFAGYTPLHLAVTFNRPEITEFLVNRGADLYIKNKKNMCPMALFVDRRMIVNRLIRKTKGGFENWTEEYENNVEVMRALFTRYNSCTDIYDLYAVCTLKERYLDERFSEKITSTSYDRINQAISMDSEKYPGYTALHFAANFNLNTVNLLIQKGANALAEDVYGVTPLDICIKKYNLEDICSLLSQHPVWKNICLSDNKTKLIHVISKLERVDKFMSLLSVDNANLSIPVECSLWPGYTMLQLAIMFSKPSDMVQIVLKFFKYRTNVNAQNAQGQTAIHLAHIYQQKVVKLMFEHLISQSELTNVVDEDNLSYLHIACAMNCPGIVEKLLTSSYVNVAYQGIRCYKYIKLGSTPLHVAVISESPEITGLLVNHGANVNATDTFGLTPIHWLLKYTLREQRKTARILLASQNLKECVTEFGLTHLHVAIEFNHTAAMEKLVEQGSKISQHVGYYFPKNILEFIPPKNTPLQPALRKLLMSLIPNSSLNVTSSKPTRLIEEGFYSDEDEEKFGFTKLHHACFVRNGDLIKHLLNEGSNVNAQVMTDSPFGPGYTPLHFLAIRGMDDFLVNASKLLLKHGADVTLANTEQDTPVHLFLKIPVVPRFSERNQDLRPHVRLLLQNQRNFCQNPVNAEGISHFHAAILANDRESACKFVQHGVDVRTAIDFFAQHWAGMTPLHMALTVSMPIVDLLLAKGADVCAEDVDGNTPLHIACCEAQMSVDVLDKLVSSGAKVDCENSFKETPFEKLVSSGERINEQFEFMMRHGCRFQQFNPITGHGYIGIYFYDSLPPVDKVFLEKIMLSPGIADLDKKGRTAIHNVVSIKKPQGIRVFSRIDFVSLLSNSPIEEAINEFIKLGCDINHRDDSGKTALHYAVLFENDEAVNALLKLGADVNIIDRTGESAFTYAIKRTSPEALYEYKGFNRATGIISSLQNHIAKLFCLKLEVSTLNIDALPEKFDRNDSRYKNIRSVYEQAVKDMPVACGFTLKDFVSFHGRAISAYPNLSRRDRFKIDEFFRSFHFPLPFDIMNDIVMVHYRKATTRLALFEDATNSLRRHLKFSLPGLCEEILSYLSYSDWINLIDSVNEIEPSAT